MNKKIPAVSVVIPMYNTEKYIGECLDSILAQTFKDFEVIVVDDCSTDNSRAVVESYIPKFKEWEGKKLYLLHTEKNSGGGGLPRNIGMKVSCGEYIIFVDSDDSITSTALEELYSLAKKFDADVVNCGRFYLTPDEKNLFKDKKFLDEFCLKERLNIKTPIILTDDLIERVKIFGQKFPAATFRLIRRKILEENNIKFPKFPIGEDEVFTLNLLMNAQNFLVVPNAVYLWRKNVNSMTRSKVSVEKVIDKNISSIIHGIREFRKLMSKFGIFRQNPALKYIVFERFLSNKMNDHLFQVYSQNPVWELNELIRRELEKLDDDTALMAFIFSKMNVFNVEISKGHQIILQQKQIINQLQAQLER